MSDTGRESLTDKAKAFMRPDSSKDTEQRTAETLRGKVDNMQGTLQPEGQKSYTQQAADAMHNQMQSGQNQQRATQNQEGIWEKTKKTMGME
ncbi:heat shock protein 9/12-domain-containing protein [Paraphysoderma sedebokerense]|nr:heat shock protein 9/12-domain-containing protein [Paraphysoderma sedebokerense]